MKKLLLPLPILLHVCLFSSCINVTDAYFDFNNKENGEVKKRFIQIKAGKILYFAYGEDKPGISGLVVHGSPGDFVSIPESVCDLAASRPV